MSRKPSGQVEEIKRAIAKPVRDDERVEFLDSGSTMFNLAASQKGKDGGWARGRIVNPVGDGSSGKTLMALEACAQAFYKIKKRQSKIFPPVKNLIMVYVNREEVMDFPLERMYNLKDGNGDPIRDGNQFTDHLQMIHNLINVEQVGRDFGKRCIEHQPGDCLLYVVDSWDSLTSEVGEARFKKAALQGDKSAKKVTADDGDGKEDGKQKGSYNTDKAAYASKEFFNNVCSLMAGKDITLFIISQTRTKIGITFGDKHYRSGGDALNFYTHQVPWLAVVKKLQKTYHGDQRVIGVRMLANFKRNKVAKPYRQAETTILFDFGVDNIGSMINYLWGPEADKINFDGADFSRKDLIAYIEDNDLEGVLIDMCEKEWLEVEAAVIPVRKPRFGNQNETTD